MKISIIVILFIISTFATAEEVCNKTQLDLFTHFSLAQQN